MRTVSKQRSLYVTQTGSDKNPGTLEQPFASLECAKQHIRTLKKSNDSPMHVYVGEGTYYLREPLHFTSTDAGQENAPIHFMPYENQKVTLSGGRKIIGAWQPYCDGIMPRAAICINDGTWGGHIIEYNDIHDTVLETGDHGPFNSWGRERFWCFQQSHGPVSHTAGDVLLDAKYTTIIRNNRFIDHSGWGIDLDDGSSIFHIYNNLCVGISIKLREGDYRTVENNLFINGANPPGFHIGYEGNRNRVTVNPSESSNFYSKETPPPARCWGFFMERDNSNRFKKH